jgi:hypothetical protein
MAKTKNILTGDTVIVWAEIPLNDFRIYLNQALGKDFERKHKKDFGEWLNTQMGKTLQEAVDDYMNNYQPQNITETLSERRFDFISEADKAFIIAFDKAMDGFGYDCANLIGSGNNFCPFMIIYGKSGTKSRTNIARIYIRADNITLRLYLNDINKHRGYIENLPPHIKNAFTFEDGDCKRCFDKCKNTRVYTIGEQVYTKCCHSTFHFANLSNDKLTDYMKLLSVFYPAKKTARQT